MAEAVVGVLRALLTMDSAQFEAGSRKASAAAVTLEKSINKLGDQTARLTPQAERMVKAFAGDKLLSQANNLTAAVAKIGGAAKLTETEQGRVNRTLTEAVAKYTALGQTAPKAMVDLANATSRAEPPTSFLTTKMVALGAAVGTFASQLALQAIRGLVQFGKDSFTAASHMVDLANKTGLSTDTLQRMKFVADQTGTSIEAMTDAAFRLGIRLDGGGRSVVSAVEKLGLSWQTLRQQQPDQQFEAIIGALGRVESTTERNRLGQELFGRSFITIAASIAEGYDKIAAAANVSSRQQLEALDRAADRWSQFVTNTKTNVTAFLGQMLLMSDAMAEVEKGQGMTTQTATRRVENLIEAQRRLALGLVGGRREDIKLTGEAAAASESYAQKLRAVQAELAKLTAADRAEIAAALQLGVSTDDLEDKYGLTAGALRILTAATKDYEQTLKHAAAEAAAAAKRWEGTLSTIRNQIGQTQFAAGAAAEQAADDAVRSAEILRELSFGVDLAARDRAALAFRAAELDDHQRREADAKRLSQTLSDIENTRGLELMAADRRRMGERGQFWQDFADAAEHSVNTLNVAVAGSFAQMALGAKKFKDGWIDIWESIKAFTIRIFADIAGAFVGGLLKKMAAGLAGTAVAGATAGAAVGTGAAAAAAAGTGAAATGGFAGLGATAAAFATNPFTIAAAGGIAAFLIGRKLFGGGEEQQVNPRRDKFFAQFGGPGTGPSSGFQKLAEMLARFGAEHLHTALRVADTNREWDVAQGATASFLKPKGRNVKLFNFGGFVPPGVTQPAILHGGAFGEDVIPRSRPNPQAMRNTTVVFNIQAWDTQDMNRAVRSQIIPRLKQAITLNTDDFAAHSRRVLVTP